MLQVGSSVLLVVQGGIVAEYYSTRLLRTYVPYVEGAIFGSLEKLKSIIDRIDGSRTVLVKEEATTYTNSWLAVVLHVSTSQSNQQLVSFNVESIRCG